MRIPFVKMHGCGNDFVLMDEYKSPAISEKMRSGFAKQVCDRHRSIGADGAIYLRTTKKDTALAARFFMPDGSESEMCGNGARCVAAYAVYDEITPLGREITITTMSRTLKARVISRRRNLFMVQVSLGCPKLAPREIPMRANGHSFINKRIHVPDYGAVEITAVNTGVPHAVIFVDNIEDLDVERLGRAVRSMRKIFPCGTNVDFAKFDGMLSVRTYERGVENETLSCGTGVAASTVAAFLTGRVSANRPVRVLTRAGYLDVTVAVKGRRIQTILLKGPAEVAFLGEIDFYA